MMARVAIVPPPTRGVPPGVTVGDVVSARRMTCCVYAVKRITGSPSAMTMSAPGKTQSGSPIPMIAARATIATMTNAAAYVTSAFLSMPRPPSSTAGIGA